MKEKRKGKNNKGKNERKKKINELRKKERKKIKQRKKERKTLGRIQKKTSTRKSIRTINANTNGDGNDMEEKVEIEIKTI